MSAHNHKLIRRCVVFVLTTSCACVVLVGQQPSQQQSWFDRQTQWNGFDQFHFKVADRAAYVVAPRKPANGQPWVWRARFPNYHAEADVELLKRGFHVAYVDVAGLFGSPAAVKIGDEFYDYLVSKRGFARKPALEGVSRGGLFVYNWAVENLDNVACIYCDTPVLDIRSWPGGKGTGLGSASTWQQCLKAYGLNELQAESFDQNPLDHATTIAKSKIPLMHIVSENDRVVPPQENTYLFQKRLQQAGQPMKIILVPEGTAKSNGHHFEHPSVDQVVDFIARHTASEIDDRMELLRHAKRIVFLGNSITYGGDYVAMFDTWLLTQNLKTEPVVINVGLPSETVSGLSEAGHAQAVFHDPISRSVWSECWRSPSPISFLPVTASTAASTNRSTTTDSANISGALKT